MPKVKNALFHPHFYFFERQRNKETCHLLVHALNAHNNQGNSQKLHPDLHVGGRNSTACTTICCFRHISRKLDQKQ